MKRVVMLTVMMSFVLALSAMAQTNGNGNGTMNQFNHRYQYLNDADGDGIPNGQDPDYVRPTCDSTGIGSRYQWGHRFANTIREGVGSTMDSVHGLWIRLRERLRIDQ